jgi:hypothetical protein
MREHSEDQGSTMAGRVFRFRGQSRILRSMNGEGAGQRLLAAFAQIPDPRVAKGRRHPLPAILALATAAMLCGARSLYAIWQWGRLQDPAVVAALGFTHGQTPAVSTLHLVFRRLDAAAFEAAVQGWAQAEFGGREGAIAIDGKALRGIHGEELPGVRLVAAYTDRAGLVLAQTGGQDPRAGGGTVGRPEAAAETGVGGAGGDG